eukprot:CAMPEP_0194075458 /NCGR_PEP_ID=MMETSP0149-20130528/2459_1 /TAXON_ID=122233 /ORGANISM="Chaetoceros debilis, Strain MM31A-1" /LENGTH=477 /DNA_ID=CAMNT_0038755943 /DNA_START=225 /DNA_END=1654 /DNA_ORIENTATION=-
MMLYLLVLPVLPASYLGLILTIKMQSVSVSSFQQPQHLLNCRHKNSWNRDRDRDSNYNYTSEPKVALFSPSPLLSSSSKGELVVTASDRQSDNNHMDDGNGSRRDVRVGSPPFSLDDFIPKKVAKKSTSQHHERRGFLSRTLMGLGLGSTATISAFTLPSVDVSAATTTDDVGSSASASASASASQSQRKSITVKGGTLTEVNDPQTYPALVYQPEPKPKPDLDEGVITNNSNKLPVLIVLHGAGKNELGVWNLADIHGEHAGLIPSLLASGKAPPELYENFIVIAPYSIGKASFYDEPRSKLLQCIRWACGSSTTTVSSSQQGGGGNGGIANTNNMNSVTMQGIDTDRMDLSRVYLFGFSDGATLGIELMTTRKFAAGIFAAYGFTGKLPKLALERMQDLPMWIFHSQDDVIFPVKCSDQLVKDLRAINSNSNANASVNAADKGGDSIVRYSRFQQDQEGFTGSVKGHSTGITASR